VIRSAGVFLHDDCCHLVGLIFQFTIQSVFSASTGAIPGEALFNITSIIFGYRVCSVDSMDPGARFAVALFLFSPA